MSPTDPRHGTNAGYIAGCRCDDCRRASTRYHKELMLDHERGQRRLVDNVGTQRRVKALMRLGYSGERIATELGVRSQENVREYRTRPRINRTTAEKVAEVYERLSMQLPVGETRYERQIISRTRKYAERQGWLPPLAWDDIDDPNERPIGWEYRPASRADLLHELDERGDDIHQVLRVIKISEEGLWKWCREHGMGDLYRRFVERTNVERSPNQYSEAS